jgi:hypothetical protein
MSVYDKLNRTRHHPAPRGRARRRLRALRADRQAGLPLSGHIAKKDGKPWVGQLGLTMTTEEGKAAARAMAIDLMGTLQAACKAAGETLNASSASSRS